MKLKASLEAVRTKKDTSDDIVQTIVFNVFATPDQIGMLNELYKKPIEITIEEVS
jgi:hypothetical protein